MVFHATAAAEACLLDSVHAFIVGSVVKVFYAIGGPNRNAIIVREVDIVRMTLVCGQAEWYGLGVSPWRVRIVSKVIVVDSKVAIESSFVCASKLNPTE